MRRRSGGATCLGLGGAILFGGVIGPVLLMFGLMRGAAGQSALLLNLESVLTLGIAWVVFARMSTGGF